MTQARDVFDLGMLMLGGHFTTATEQGVFARAEVADAAERLMSLTWEDYEGQVVEFLDNTNHPHFHPSACVPYLLGKEQGYVSFLTALHLHGVISQIPQTVQVATTGRGRRLESTIGLFEMLRIKPEFMREGIEWSDTHQPYLIAVAEKALLDVLYLSTRKNRRFATLPGLDLTSSGFRAKEFERLLRELPYSIRIASAIETKWNKLRHLVNES